MQIFDVLTIQLLWEGSFPSQGVDLMILFTILRLSVCLSVCLSACLFSSLFPTLPFTHRVCAWCVCVPVCACRYHSTYAMPMTTFKSHVLCSATWFPGLASERVNLLNHLVKFCLSFCFLGDLDQKSKSQDYQV